MDVLIWFNDSTTDPSRYVLSERDMLEVTWDDVDYGNPFSIEGNERVVMRIVTEARRNNDCKKVVFL